MRKYLYVAMAAASAAVLAAPVVADAAPAAHSHVLTIKKTGGTAVKQGATLTASLVKGTSAVFSLGTIKITCTQSSFKAVVVKNPTAPGKATEKITVETIGKCTVNIKGVTIKKVKALNLPYNSTVSDAKKKFTVTVSGRKKTKPIELMALTAFGMSTFSCTYKAASIAGSASNKGNTITIVKQKFTKASGPSCPTGPTATFSAKYGPVRDISVKGKPAVFVN